MLQDRDGFMWFGTETGLCRFDGARFRTFTTKDGLPDNEILRMYEDSKGRIWLIPFRNAICYYYKGRIMTQENDSVLRKINIRDRILNVFETADGTIWMNETEKVYKIVNDSVTQEFDRLGDVPLRSVFLFEKDAEDRVWFSVSGNTSTKIYTLSDNRVVFFSESKRDNSQNEFSFTGPVKSYKSQDNNIILFSEKLNITDSIPYYLYVNLTKIIPVNDSLVALNFREKTVLYNISSRKVERTLFEGEQVTGILMDSEGSTWISTHGNGVFRNSSKNFLKLDLPGIDLADKNVYVVDIINDKLYLGFNNYTVGIFDLGLFRLDTVRVIHPFENFVKVIGFVDAPPSQLVVSNFYIDKLTPGLPGSKRSNYLFPKQVQKKGKELIIATTRNVVRLDITRFRVTDTIWNSRATSVFELNDSVFIGTLKGLYLMANGRTEYWGDRHSFFRGRISAIDKSPDNSLWVATYDNGIARVTNGSVREHYTSENGLSSDICRAMAIDEASVWVGTDKGISRIAFHETNGGKPIRITRSGGLSSDFINKILVTGDTVFVATADGVTYFDKTLLDQYSECKLNILEVSGEKLVQNADSSYRVGDRRLTVNFAGISYKSAGVIIYKYRLKGVNNNWQETRENSLEFVSLPYGDYTLELMAENKFGVMSPVKSIKLNVPVPFWKSISFYTLLAAIAGLLTFLIYTRRLNTIRKKEEEKTDINKKMAEMELKALRAQMNPHFTFNVLNSIQYFISYNDTVAAQKYLSRFAKLIRMTLDHSKKVFIKLSDEIKLLELYLELEQMRFEMKFSYSISVDDRISPENIEVPNMLIQPFVENAVKHGFKGAVKNPEIRLSLLKKEDAIECQITDNGIGRKKSAIMQSGREKEHRSAGIEMIKDKVEALKYYYKYCLSLEIEDVISATDEIAGTRVVIRFPVQKTRS